MAPGEKIPSVRELAVGMGVNSHTVLKAFDELQQQGLITPRRGMGFFLADNAPRLVQQKEQARNSLSTPCPKYSAGWQAWESPSMKSWASTGMGT